MEQEHDSAILMKGSEILASGKKSDREFRVKVYDFKRPDKFSMEQIRTIYLMHQTFSGLASLTLTGLIRRKTDLRVATVDQLTYSEFIASVDKFSPLAVLSMAPLKGYSILQFDPQIRAFFADMLLGGSGDIPEAGRESTPVETALIRHIAGDLAGDLREAWEPLERLEASVTQMEVHPSMLKILPPSEMVVAVTFEIRIGETEGLMNLCIPFLVLEPVLDRLTARYWYSMARGNREGCVTPATLSSLEHNCEIITETVDLSLEEIGRLKKGSLIELPGYAAGSASLLAGGQIVMDGRLKKKRGFLEFAGSGAALPEFLREVSPAALRNETAMERLTVRIEELGDALSSRMDRLTEGQDHLNDQVFFRSEDQPVRHEGEPFSFLGLPDLPVLREILDEENPQAAALVLSRIDSGLGAELLGLFGEEEQPGLVKRISLMQSVSKAVLDLVEGILKVHFSRKAENPEPRVKGLEKVAQILGVSSRNVEASVILSLEKSDSALAEEIKKRMFVFEDIILVDGKSVAKALERAGIEDFCLAMKMVAEEKVKDHILSSIPEKRRSELKKCLGDKGRVRISDADRAQQRIIEVLRVLEEEGELVIGRNGETI